MKARKTSELVGGDFIPMKCDSCGKICEDEDVTEGYFLEPETEDELKQLEKVFPNEQVVFVCEDCLSKFSIARPLSPKVVNTQKP